MSKYTTNGAEVKESTYVPKYLEHSQVVIGAIQAAEYAVSSNKGTPGITLHFVATEPSEGLNNQYHPVKGYETHQFCSNQFWLTENAMMPTKISSITKFLKLLAGNLKGEEGVIEWETKAATAESDEEYAQLIEEYFGGMEFAGLIAGERQYYNDKTTGEPKSIDKSYLNYFGTFARPVANVDYLQAIVDGGKVNLFKDAGQPADAIAVTENVAVEDNLLD